MVGKFIFRIPKFIHFTFGLKLGDGNYINYAHPNAERKEPLFHFGPVGSMTVRKRRPKKKASPKKASSQIPSTPSNLKGKKSVAENSKTGTAPLQRTPWTLEKILAISL